MLRTKFRNLRRPARAERCGITVPSPPKSKAIHLHLLQHSHPQHLMRQSINGMCSLSSEVIVPIGGPDAHTPKANCQTASELD